jgi:hypothetical protein
LIPLSESANAIDIECIEKRQLKRPTPGIIAVEKARCKYGNL